MVSLGERIGRRQGWLLFVLLTAQFMSNVDVSVVNVASPAIHTHLGASGAQMQFIVSGYVFAFAVLLVTGARLGDLRGYRRMFLCGLAVFTVASLACALAPNPASLIAFRVAQGVGAAIMIPQVMTGIQLNFAGRVRVKALAYYALSLSSGAVAGQVLGGVLLSANLFGASWRPLFMINVPVGVLLLAAGVVFLPHDEPRARDGMKRLDLAGVGLVLAAMLLLTVPLVLGRKQNWPVWIWVSMVVSVPVLALFVLVENRVARRGGYPLLNMEILRWPRIAWGLVAQFAVQGTYFAILFILALYLQQGLGRSPAYSGLALLPWVIAFGVVGFAVRKLPARFARFAPASGYLWLALSYAALSIVIGSGNHSGPVLMTLLCLGGLGLGTGFNALLGHLTSSMPPRYAPDFSGAHSTILQVSGTLGVAVFGTVYLAVAPHGGSAAAIHGFSLVCALLAGMGLVAAVAAYCSTHSTAITEPVVPKPQLQTVAQEEASQGS